MASPVFDGLFRVLGIIIMHCDVAKCFETYVEDVGGDVPREDCFLMFAEYPVSSGLIGKFMNDDCERRDILKIVCHMCLECAGFSACIVEHMVDDYLDSLDEKFVVKILTKLLVIDDRIDRAHMIVDIVCRRMSDDEEHRHKFVEILASLVRVNDQYLWDAILGRADYIFKFLVFGDRDTRAAVYQIVDCVNGRGLNALEVNILEMALPHLNVILKHLTNLGIDQDKAGRVCVQVEKFFELLVKLVDTDERQSLLSPKIETLCRLLDVMLVYRDVSSTCCADVLGVLDRATDGNEGNLEALLSDAEFNWFVTRMDHVSNCDADFDEEEIERYLRIVRRCCGYSEEFVRGIMREPGLCKAFKDMLWEVDESKEAGETLLEVLRVCLEMGDPLFRGIVIRKLGSAIVTSIDVMKRAITVLLDTAVGEKGVVVGEMRDEGVLEMFCGLWMGGSEGQDLWERCKKSGSVENVKGSEVFEMGRTF
jgi:hypothetical protein